MALHRGIQSAVFYYLSCAPCTEARTRRKRRKEADLLRQEKEVLATCSQANGSYQYDHPLPSTTNPAWGLEIALGPSKESKAAARSSKSKAKETPPRSSGSTSKSERKDHRNWSTPDLGVDGRARWAESFQRNARQKSVTVPPKAKTFPTAQPKSGLSPLSETRDEPVVAQGSPPTTSSDQSASESVIQRPQPSKLATTSLSSPAWQYLPHPPLNDHHPPTVTKYSSPKDTAWMLAPPPNAKVMRGHEPELPRHLSPRKRTPTLESRPSRPTTRQADSDAEVAVRSTDVSPSDARGLGLEFESAQEDIDADGPVIEKRDSAGPQPGQSEAGKYLFPPRDWDMHAARRDSGSESGFTDPRKGEEREVRWRWSIDYNW
ncbi:hypothetical protein CAC42_6085 [Sphaceloma murrayae]|uniref:Uncharacterized protein n=1 Tax=Sphaceloma murrayae TaxID=2082308 RepID=A0A2K1QVL0_9PEZI|nr:hypothetical protein CAC42_6085 [Sphaceloma murrayae]